jgi:HD-GYP domain-containing protein (c-di-GMP phosphodiesterase class II)
MKYVPIPVDMLEVGKPMPVDVWGPSGQLLLRKGQPVVSAEHRDKLGAHRASSTESDALAWQRSYERMVHTLLRQGMDVQAVAKQPMPSEIRESDYVVVKQMHGGWLDLQEVLRGILYQGGLAINPLQRLAGIEKKALTLVQADPDDCLFALFQALADDSLGYCATHALLSAVVCELTAQKIGLDGLQRQALVRAALTMNVGMARDQDSLARQSAKPTAWQRKLIEEHPVKSVAILQAYGLDDPDPLDIVRWHHAPESPAAAPGTLPSRRLLQLADSFIARMAARKTRSALSPVSAVKSMVMGAQGEKLGLGSAMAQAVGFYPPGTYVRLLNGEVAVAVQRGERANTPWVVSIIDKDGMPISRYVARETTTTAQSIATPVSSESVRVVVNAEKVLRAREKIPR